MFTPFEDKEQDFHIIRIKHPLLNYYGFNAATTGQLVNWWNQQNYKKEFKNRSWKFLTPLDTYEETRRAGEFLNLFYSERNDQDNYVFSCWRKEGYNGRNIKFYAPTLTNLETEESWTYTSLDADKNIIPVYNYEDLGWDGADGINCLGTISQVDFPDGSGQFPKWFVRLINSHNSVMKYGYGGLGIDEKSWPKCLQARLKLSQDLMINGGIKWSGILQFNINLDNVQCTKNEYVEYQLELLDATNIKKQHDNYVAFKEFMISKVPTDVAGRPYSNESNGEITTGQNVPANQSAGELSLNWNPVSKKWESGTLQVPAILGTDIPAANKISFDELEASNVESLLNNPSADIYLNMPSGYAIPLVALNGNPTTIGAMYDGTNGCRNNNDKLKLIVHNPFPRSWSKDERVMLSKINDVWIPLDPGKSTEPAVVGKVDGKWDFMYLMTNADYYFTTINEITGRTSGIITNSNYEAGIRAKYYEDDTLNGNPQAINFAKVSNSFFQVTSWDFMGPTIGGLRDNGHAIACTHYDKMPNGDPISLDLGDPEGGYWSAPFFGCVFPDGYDLGDKYSQYTSTHPILLSKNNNIEDENYLDPSQLIFNKNIESNVNLFENQNVNTARGNGGGMFILSGDTSVAHLPADIALNSSPSGSNGSALKPIAAFRYLTSIAPSYITDFRNNLHKAFFSIGKDEKVSVWINQSGNDYSSAFDFKPKNNAKLVFRPLKLETYAAFEFAPFSPVPKGRGYNWFFSPNPGSVPETEGSVRGEFGARVWNIMSDNQSPIALDSWERNKNNDDKKYGNIYTYENLLYGYRGLRYNIDIDTRNSRLSSYPVDDGLFPVPNWSRGWMHGAAAVQFGQPFAGGSGNTEDFLNWLDKKRGVKNFRDWADVSYSHSAGAVGIIGAQCTVTASESIKIQCESLIGIGSWTFGVSRNQSYGLGNAFNYNSFDTTALFVRAFHAWPRELTVYDPRFFSVFHFNPGVGMVDDDQENEEFNWYLNGSLRKDEPGEDAIRAYPNGWYKVQKSQTSVDIRVPTSSAVGSDGISGPYLGYVYSNNVRRLEHSNLDYRRRGRLLPYKYIIPTIGLSVSNSLLAYKTNQMKTVGEIDLIILSPGSNYSTDDRFTTSGGRGKGVLLKPILGTESYGGFTLQNAIIGFELAEPGLATGYGFSSENFLKPDTEIYSRREENSQIATIFDQNDKAINMNVIIVPVGAVKGAGFTGGFVRGYVHQPVLEDKKPAEIISNLKLTDEPTGAELTEPYLGFGEKLINIAENPNLDNTYKLKNKYDLFFHFHNDVSFTYTKSKGTIPNPVEQHATINIVPV